MSRFRRDFETDEQFRARLARESVFEEPVTVETDIGKVLDQPDIVIKPGNAYARAAFRLGREDEYIDRMRSRYGGEW